MGESYHFEKLFKLGREETRYNHWFHVVKSTDSNKVTDIKNIGPNFPEAVKVHLFEVNAQNDESRIALQNKALKKANETTPKDKSNTDDTKQGAKSAQQVKTADDLSSDHRSGKKRNRHGKGETDDSQGNP